MRRPEASASRIVKQFASKRIIDAVGSMNPVGTGARAQEIDGEFVVLKGSTALRQGIPSWKSNKALRDQLVQEGKLADGPNPSLYVFTGDVPLNSPGAAAAVVFGGNQRGPLVWRTEDGSRTYLDWQEEKLKQAGVKLAGGGSRRLRAASATRARPSASKTVL